MNSRQESKSRSLLATCTTAALVGIALSTGANQEVGAWVTLAGLLGLIFSVHRFGRLGPEPPIELSGQRSAKLPET